MAACKAAGRMGFSTSGVRSLVLLAAASFVSLGCGSGLRQATQFEGEASPSLVEPEQIGEAPDTPTQHVSLGKVSAQCTLVEGVRRLEKEWLSDVDCSVSRLTRALQERAADVGGTLLTGRYCYSSVVSADEDERRTRVRCEAGVARPTKDALWAKNAKLADTPPNPDPPASESWRIKVAYKPAYGVTPRPARRWDLVEEHVQRPISHVRLGDVVTRCERGCSRQAAHHGLLAAAGRMGAHAIVGTSCVKRRKGWLCTAEASGYEADPDLDPEAH